MARQGAGRQSCECLVSRASHYNGNVTHDLVINGREGGGGQGRSRAQRNVASSFRLTQKERMGGGQG
jgi:hypothetical protein